MRTRENTRKRKLLELEAQRQKLQIKMDALLKRKVTLETINQINLIGYELHKIEIKKDNARRMIPLNGYSDESVRVEPAN